MKHENFTLTEASPQETGKHKQTKKKREKVENYVKNVRFPLLMSKQRNGVIL